MVEFPWNTRERENLRAENWHGFLEGGVATKAGAWLNRIPLSYSARPVYIGKDSYRAPSFDRYLYLWLHKMRWMGASDLEMFGSLCKPGMNVVDVGANLGLHSLRMSREVGSAGRVWAFEADAANFRCLEENLRANACANALAFNYAVGNATRSTVLFRSASHSGDHRVYSTVTGRESVPVEMTTLDDFFPAGQRIDLIKIDVQGAEGFVMEGMRRLLRDNPGISIWMEFWPHGLRSAGHSPHHLLADFSDLGFTIGRIDSRRRTVSPVENPEQWSKGIGGARFVDLLLRGKAYTP